MKNSVVISLLTLAVTLVGAGQARANAIINGGFESGALAPWFQDHDLAGGGTSWFVTAADAHNGGFSATDVGNKELRQNITPTLTSSISEISFWMKHPEGAGQMFIDLFYTDSTDTGFIVTSSDAGWDFFDVTGNLGAGKTLSGFSVFGDGGPGAQVTFLDDVTITSSAVPEPSSFALMGFGSLVLAVGAYRRRRAAAV
jgi:hypothetical protein